MSTVVEQIRKARDLMNHSGRHWVKGAAHGYVPKNHRPGGQPASYAKTSDASEHAYCSIGALGKLQAEVLAYIEVAKALRPKAWAKAEKKARAEVEKHGFSEGWLTQSLKEEACAIIVSANDSRKTKWPEIRTAFTQAARRVSQRKG